MTKKSLINKGVQELDRKGIIYCIMQMFSNKINFFKEYFIKKHQHNAILNTKNSFIKETLK